MSDIEHRRAEILREFANASPEESEPTVELSPGGRFKLTTRPFVWRTSERRQTFCTVKVEDLLDGSTVAEFIRDDDRFWHTWMKREEEEYLICSEFLEGQTVINMSNHEMASISTVRTDPFIWTEK